MGRPARLLAALAVLVIPSTSLAARPLHTAVVEDAQLSGAQLDLALQRTKAAGATFVRTPLDWSTIARQRPKNPANPADPAYDWSSFDRLLSAALRHGLQPIASVEQAPKWAQDDAKPLPFEPVDPSLRGAVRPSAAAFGVFVRAAALRYGGSFAALPRIRFWRAWNEPNLSLYILPQYSAGGAALSPPIYRALLNAFADAVHGVHADNVVIGGNTSPLSVRTKYVQGVAPLRFMRDVLCISKGKVVRPTCGARAKLDVWAVQPYTSGGPTHRARQPGGVALGDLPQVRRVLTAAYRVHKVVSRSLPQLWVTEFGWDTRPPDRNQYVLPVTLQARFVSEALYHAWQAGVTLFTWYQLRDEQYLPTKPAQGGLYFWGGESLTRDAPKPALPAFRFPFVAYRNGSRTTLWGRTPAGKPATVVIEASTGAGWRRIGALRTNGFGIFQGSVTTPRFSSRRPAHTEAAASPNAYRRLVMRDSPTSYWHLDDAAGPVAADSAGAHPGRYQGGVRRGVAGAFGAPDRAVVLNGRSGRVLLGRLQTPGSVELWLKTSARNEAAAFSNRNSISRFTFLGVWGFMHARAFDSAGLSSRTWITDGRWHHLAYTYDGARGRLYVDGRLDDTGAWTRFEGSSQAYLGYDATLKTHLSGAIDEVAVYPKALTAAQVRAHFAASGRPRTYGGEFAIMQAGQTYLRARLARGSVASLPFSLTPVPDRYVNPLGR